jgi:flagellar motor switch protein FliN
MSQALRWRPLASSDADHACLLAQRAIGRWRENWFGSRPGDEVSVEVLRVVSSGDPAPAALETPAKAGTRALAALALDLPVSILSQADSGTTAAIDLLGARIAEELFDALHPLTRQAEAALPAACDTGVLLCIKTSCGSELSKLVIPAAVLLERRIALDHKTQTNSALTSRQRAIANMLVEMHAYLGRAELTLDQLLGLVPGDVITVETKLDEAVEVLIPDAVSTRHRIAACGRLGRTAHRLSIQLQPQAARNTRMKSTVNTKDDSIVVNAMELPRQDENAESPPSNPLISRPMDIVGDVMVALDIRLGKAVMSIDKLMSLAAGSIVELDRHLEERVDVLLNGRLIGKAEIVAVGDHFGIRMAELANGVTSDD